MNIQCGWRGDPNYTKMVYTYEVSNIDIVLAMDECNHINEKYIPF